MVARWFGGEVTGYRRYSTYLEYGRYLRRYHQIVFVLRQNKEKLPQGHKL